MKVYIASKLTNKKQRELNNRIYNLCIKFGLKVFLPQKELPLGSRITARHILETNEKAVDDSDFIIAVFDRAGVGVAMELERARMLKKNIIGYRSKRSQESEYLGKMLQGAWDRLPKRLKTGCIRELENILSKVSYERSNFS